MVVIVCGGVDCEVEANDMVDMAVATGDTAAAAEAVVVVGWLGLGDESGGCCMTAPNLCGRTPLVALPSSHSSWVTKRRFQKLLMSRRVTQHRSRSGDVDLRTMWRKATRSDSERAGLMLM